MRAPADGGVHPPPLQDFLLKYLGATVAVYLIIGPFFKGHMRPENTVQGRAQVGAGAAASGRGATCSAGAVQQAPRWQQPPG